MVLEEHAQVLCSFFLLSYLLIIEQDLFYIGRMSSKQRKIRSHIFVFVIELTGVRI